jgi:cytochrome c556
MLATTMMLEERAMSPQSATKPAGSPGNARGRHHLVLAIASALVLALELAPIQAQAPAASSSNRALVTIKELMEKTITPATNRLWNVPEAPTDQDWAALEEAAITLLVAASVNAAGGTGPKDNEWVKQPAWKPFNEVMISAGQMALEAIRARKTDGLLAAGDVLYPPCEGCHMQFNPAAVEEQR